MSATTPCGVSPGLPGGDEPEVVFEVLQHAAGGDPPDRSAAGAAEQQDRVDPVAHQRALGLTERRILRQRDHARAHEVAHRRVEAAVGDAVRTGLSGGRDRRM
jgi:hypothetical protein